MKKFFLITILSILPIIGLCSPRIPMWRIIHEQNGDKHYLDVGSFRFEKKTWVFGYKIETPKENKKLTATRYCKKSDNGYWSRITNVKYCQDGECVSGQETDWDEFTEEQVGHYVCEAVLPFCDDKKKFPECISR